MTTTGAFVGAVTGATIGAAEGETTIPHDP